MRHSIGIFAAERSMPAIEAMDEVFRKKCDVTYISYTSVNHLANLYVQNIRVFDGVLFSGAFPYQYVVQNFGIPQKPHSYFELSDREYYKIFAKLLYEKPGLKISRVLMEASVIDFDFSEIFGDERPKMIEARLQDLEYLQNAYETMYSEAIRLWRNGEIDLVITRLTNVEAALKEAGVPTIKMFPSSTTLLETFNSVFQRIQIQKLDHTLVAYAIIAPSDESAMDDTLRVTLREELTDFNEKNGMPFVIRKMETTFELITSNEAMTDITAQYTDCHLTAQLQKTVSSAIRLGWGIGSDIIQAQKNAQLALRQAKRSPQPTAFAVTEEGTLIGPLQLGKSIEISETPAPELVALGQQIGISTQNLQKLNSLVVRRGLKRFTSSDIAYHLNITLRSANRILTKLAEYGAIVQVQVVHTNVKGRPYMLYELNKENLQSMKLIRF